MSSPHDAFCKKSLSDKSVAKGLVHQSLKADLKSELDFRTLKLCQTHFVNEEMKQSESDMVYTIKTKVTRATVYLLFEHQSKPDKTMSLRVMEYSLRLCRDHLNQKNTKLPIVIPILLYNGHRKYPYSAAFSDYFEDPGLAKSQMFNSFALVDLSQISDEELLAHPDTAVMTFAMKHVRKNDLKSFKQLLDSELLQQLNANENQLRWVLNYALDVLGANFQDKVLNLVEKMKKGKKMISIAESLRREGRVEGRVEGKEAGILEGETYGIEKTLSAIELVHQGYTDKQIREKLHISQKMLKAIKSRFNQLLSQ